ncbi:Cytosolic Fe-S cluster assembly factor nar1 [Tilletia horrida]|uniref:Cytosolic Fe-S cluster assembly factor NAR1 n=1 Tax=Tilletia horrida TaxID=155126 RepID=A0AAN6GQ22_9BASI|nr:Cytosolic Fe-S cluster assembly factor nar1 [Tilletia horrida]
MAFSGALTLTDLNDFLGPSQACIKPVEHTLPQHDDDPQQQQEASTQISIDSDGQYYEHHPATTTASTSSSSSRPRTKLETAQISLNDCLACSGCVTSAETVLITMQSHHEMKRAISSPEYTHALLVASISPQSLASLSARYSIDNDHNYIPLHILLHRITHFLQSRFGFHYVFDTTFPRQLALHEHALEFQERKHRQQQQEDDQLALPMLASACPGWVCYAEKTHSELLPLISTTKSPQQIAGVLAKHHLPSLLPSSSSSSVAESSSAKVYHVTIMPCYDKKLEASRSDFYDEITGTRDVDCVLTTGELDLLMQEEGFDLTQPLPSSSPASARLEALSLSSSSASAVPADSARSHLALLPTPPDSKQASENGELVVVGSPQEETPTRKLELGPQASPFPSLLTHPGSSSGSYLFHLMSTVWQDWLASSAAAPSSEEEKDTDANDHHNHNHHHLHLQPSVEVRIIRSSDFTEYILRAPPGSGQGRQQRGPILFKGAQCYGFRNLQNLVRKVHKQVGITSKKAGRAGGSSGGGGASPFAAGTGGSAAGGGRGRARMSARGRRGGMVKAGGGGGGGGAVRRAGGAEKEEEQEGDDAEVALKGESGVERGYDYIEVMACPSGCTNGGGQLRPPPTQQSTGLDPEGFSDGWAKASANASAAGMAPSDTPFGGQGAAAAADMVVDIGLGAGAAPDMTKGWQGTTKEWVKRVEAAYWTPTSSSSRSGADDDDDDDDKQAVLQSRISGAGLSSREVERRAERGLAFVAGSGGPDALESSVLDTLKRAGSSASRTGLFRTRYHAVQDNEVSGLAVQW